jgi:glycosidase
MKGRRLEGGNVLGYEDQNGNPITVYDEPRRQPFLWGTEDSAMTTWFPLIDGNDEVKIASAQQKDKDSLYNTYKEMIQIRKDNPALFYGNKITRINSIPGSIAFIREIELDNFKQYILVVHNITSATKEIEFDVIREIYGSKTLEPQQTYIAEISSNVIE